jgi:hypothetical protein
MIWSRSCFFLIGIITCGWICQFLLAQVPAKNPSSDKPNPPRYDDGREWINSLPDRGFGGVESSRIKESDIYEVVASKKYVPVIRDLKERPYVKLDSNLAKYFTGHYFKCPDGKTPYLIRAVYCNGGTGEYTVTRAGRKLLVIHGSLGDTVLETKSALVVTLDFEPEVVYIDVVVAR